MQVVTVLLVIIITFPLFAKGLLRYPLGNLQTPLFLPLALPLRIICRSNRSLRLNSFSNRFALRNRRCANGLNGRILSEGVGDWESIPVFDHVLANEDFALGLGDAEFEGGWLAGTVSSGEGACAL